MYCLRIHKFIWEKSLLQYSFSKQLKAMLDYKITTHGEFLELKNHGHYRSPHEPHKTEVLEELPNTDY